MEACENCHEAIISKEDFEKVAAMRKRKYMCQCQRKHETHCLTGKMICSNCGHRLSHTYARTTSITVQIIIWTRLMKNAISVCWMRM